MNQSFQDAVHRRLRYLGSLMHVFQRHRLTLALDDFQYVECLGENRDEIEPLRRCLSQVGHLCKNFPKPAKSISKEKSQVVVYLDLSGVDYAIQHEGLITA